MSFQLWLFFASSCCFLLNASDDAFPTAESPTHHCTAELDPATAAWNSVWETASQYIEHGGPSHPDYPNFFRFVLTSPHLEGYDISDEGMELWIAMRLPIPNLCYINPATLTKYINIINDDIQQTNRLNFEFLKHTNALLGSVYSALLLVCEPDTLNSNFEQATRSMIRSTISGNNLETIEIHKRIIRNCINIGWYRFQGGCYDSARDNPFLHNLRTKLHEHFIITLQLYLGMPDHIKKTFLPSLYEIEEWVVAWQMRFPHALAIWNGDRRLNYNVLLRYNWLDPRHPTLRPHLA